MIIYVETDLGFCLREAKSIKDCKRAILRDGTFITSSNDIQVCRKATQKDLDHVQMMGGYIPEKVTRKRRKW